MVQNNSLRFFFKLSINLRAEVPITVLWKTAY